MYLPDVVVLSLAKQLVKHPDAFGHLQASDGATLLDVKLEQGRISVDVLEGPEKGVPLREFSVLELTVPQVYVFGRAYRLWLVAQAAKHGLKEPLWE